MTYPVAYTNGQSGSVQRSTKWFTSQVIYQNNLDVVVVTITMKTYLVHEMHQPDRVGVRAYTVIESRHIGHVRLVIRRVKILIKEHVSIRRGIISKKLTTPSQHDWNWILALNPASQVVLGNP